MLPSQHGNLEACGMGMNDVVKIFNIRRQSPGRAVPVLDSSVSRNIGRQEHYVIDCAKLQKPVPCCYAPFLQRTPSWTLLQSVPR